MKKLVAVLVVIPVVAVAILYLLVLYEGPRMTEQPHVRTYQKELPQLPVGVVPVEVPVTLPSAAEAAALKSPVPASALVLAEGRLYYQYYCIFCHGEHADGNGPVGQSYDPPPANLVTPRVRSFSDGQLLRAMLTGVGHEPVLERVVKPRYRWPLVLYIHSIAGGAG